MKQHTAGGWEGWQGSSSSSTWRRTHTFTGKINRALSGPNNAGAPIPTFVRGPSAYICWASTVSLPFGLLPADQLARGVVVSKSSPVLQEVHMRVRNQCRLFAPVKLVSCCSSGSSSSSTSKVLLAALANPALCRLRPHGAGKHASLCLAGAHLACQGLAPQLCLVSILCILVLPV